MDRRVSLSIRGASLLTVLAGGLTLPAFTAPKPKSPAPARQAGLPAPSGKPVLSAAKQAEGPAEPPPGNQIMSVKDVRPGMKGYGLTVFRGTRIERFGVEVVGVLPKANMGQPLVLVKLSGGPITQRGAFLIQGMSGSPVYFNGKLLGAFAYGDAWPKDPLGMVTPIEDMLEALDPKLPDTQAGQLSLGEPLNRSATSAEGGLFRVPLDTPVINVAGGTFKPLALPVSVSGFSGRNLARVQEALAPFNMQVAQGPGSMTKPFKAELQPGSAMGGALLTGDIEMTVLGTVTYRDGDKLLGFGHPWMQMGAVQFPLTTAWIHDVFSGFQVSHKYGSPGEICGTITQDRPFGVAARIGPAPAMVPIRCKVTDSGTGRSKEFNVRAANHPLLVGQLLPIAVNQALNTVRPVPGDVVAYVKLTAETDGAGTIHRKNVFYDPVQIDVTAVRELQELMQLLSRNSFRRVPVKNLDLEVTFEDKLPTANVERIYLSQDKFEPGEDVEVGVVLRPYRKDAVLLKTKVRVPENAANGQAVLLVQGGATRVNLSAVTQGGAPGQITTLAPPPDANLGQVLKRFTDREQNNQVVVRVLFPSAAVNVNGERVSQLPSTVVDVMRSSKTTGFRIERDEVKKLQDTDYIVQGLQMLQVTVQRKDQLEKPKPSSPTRSPIGGSGGTTLSTSTAGGPSLGEDEDLEDLSVLRFTVDGKPQVLRLTTPEPDEDEEDAQARPARKAPEKPAPAKNGRRAQPAGKAPAPPADDEDDKPARPAAAAAPDSKLIGRQATVWTQTSQADFERGTALNTAVSTNGEVRLVPGLKLMHEASEQFVWSITGTGGAVYAGTGNGGQVLKVDAEGKPSVFFRTSELEVHAVARDKAGNIYAGTGPNGKVFRIAPDGKGTEILAMNGKAAADDEGGKFVLSLAVAEDGTVYAGTGPEGKIYQIKPGAAAEVLCTLPTKHVTSLLLSPDGTLYAGTAEEGSIFRVSTAGPGTPKMVYDTPQAVITGLARDRQGNLYAACAPSGEIYKIEPDGTPAVHFSKAKGALYGLIIDQGGNLLTCSANSIMRVEQDGTATILSDQRNGQFTCIAWDETGRIVAGSANIGSVYRLTPTVSGAFESTVHDAKLPARWGRIRFTAMVPGNAALAIETRSGNTPEPDVTWSAWEKATAREGSMFVSSPEARFLQYRVLFQAEQGSPALRDISIYYMPRNQAPKLTLATPVGGEILKGSYTVKWSAADPDGDTLTYEVEYSSDGGRTWKSAGEKPTSSAAPAKPEPSTRPTRASAEEALKRYRTQLDADKSMTPQQRDENYNKAKALVDRYLDDAPAAPGAPKAPAGPAAPAARTGSTRVAQITWDTTDLPDGIYQLRVTATDKASNPGEPLSDTKLTEPFIVSNTAPQLFVFSRGIEVDPAKKTAVATGFGSGRVTLKGAEFRLGTGEWTAIEAEDGIWDSANEHFRFPLADFASGEQSLEVKLVDSAGNSSITKIKFKVP